MFNILNMQITRFGITLSRLTFDDIELVRNHRNSPQISKFMENRAYISPEQQINWFNGINNDNNLYYLILHNNNKIGLINTANINWNENTGFGGVFVWNTQYWDTPTTVMALLALMDTNFMLFSLNQTFIKVLQNNKRANQYNKAIGYELLPNQQNNQFQHFGLTAERYFKKTLTLRNWAIKTFGNTTQLTIQNNTPPTALSRINQLPFENTQWLGLQIV